MDCILTHKQDITAKSGQKYVIYRGITASGDTIEAFLSAADAERFSIPDSVIVTPSQLKGLFETLPVVEVQFNQRGRVENIKA